MRDIQKIKYGNLIPVILSGGIGSRLWPLSRISFPKQYINLNPSNNYSLLQNTLLRLVGIKGLQSPIVICNEEQRFIAAEQIKELNIAPNSIILEPFGRNTAPAIALAALTAKKKYNNAILLILSADHEIKDEEKFRKTINEAITYAERGDIVTFGITPTRAETGYGYIETFEKLSILNKSSQIKRFIEKPKKELANKLFKDSRFKWNSGIFLFKANTIIEELLKFQPEIIKFCEESLKDSVFDLDFLRKEKKSFEKCPNISIDKSVMEKTNLGIVKDLDSGWNDIGSWESVWEISKKDENGNCLEGKTHTQNVKNCYLRSGGRLIVGLDIENLIVVETSDALLIANKKSSQKIKEIAEDFKKKNIPECLTNKKVHRPWGSYTSVVDAPTWQVKKLEIKPNASLSLQLHKHRAEHWIVVNGTAKVEINNKISMLSENQSIFVPLGAKHRLSNPEKNTLEIIEVQSGRYLGEDDIERFDDIYGRD